MVSENSLVFYGILFSVFSYANSLRTHYNVLFINIFQDSHLIEILQFFTILILYLYLFSKGNILIQISRFPYSNNAIYNHSTIPADSVSVVWMWVSLSKERKPIISFYLIKHVNLIEFVVERDFPQIIFFFRINSIMTRCEFQNVWMSRPQSAYYYVIQTIVHI